MDKVGVGGVELCYDRRGRPGDRSAVAYTLEDMADDAAGLLAPPTGRDAFIAHELANQEIIGTRPPLVDQAWRRALFERLYDYDIYPRGTGRQLMAVVVVGDRTASLASEIPPAVWPELVPAIVANAKLGDQP
ncbi:MAG: hypothetical protein ACYDD6_11720 [Acidimicrobiales bacterium]